jgi:hypothetical protein
VIRAFGPGSRLGQGGGSSPAPTAVVGARSFSGGFWRRAACHRTYITYRMCVGYKSWRSGSGPKPMAITLTAEEIGYLEQLAEAGVRGINAPTPHCGLQRLVDAGYATDHPVSLHGSPIFDHRSRPERSGGCRAVKRLQSHHRPNSLDRRHLHRRHNPRW